MSGKRAAGAIRSQVNDKGLHPKCAWVLHEALLLPVVMCGMEAILWRRKRGL